MQVLRQEDGDGCGGGKPSIIYKLLHFLIYLRQNFITFLQLNNNYEAVKHVDCSTVKQTYLDGFNADAALESFLTSSTLGLQTSAGQDNDTQQRPNICNEDRIVNIATVPAYRHASRY